MSVEDELELVEKPKYVPYKRPGVDRTYHAVSTIFLEDIERIYRAVDSTLDERKQERQDDIARWQNQEKAMADYAKEYGKEYEPSTLPDRYKRPLIEMRNEEYKYKSLEQVAQIPRVGFKEFHLSTEYRGVQVKIKPGEVTLETQSDEPEFGSSVDRIHSIVTSRQNRLVDFLLFSRLMIVIWSVAWGVYLISAIIPGYTWYAAIPIITAWGGVLARIIYWAIYSRRRFAAIPRYERDARLSFMDKHGTALRVLGTLLSIVVAVLVWMFPRD